MIKNKTGLNFNQKLNKYLIHPINETANQENDTIINQTKKLTEVKDVKFSYPKNGLYGLL